MIRARGWRTITGTIGYGVSCMLAVVVLAVAGYAHYVQNKVGGLASSNVDTGGPQTGAMNILLMGLESRTDYNGNVLSARLLNAMHAGSQHGVEFEGVGGQDTNTLILIHIFAGGQKAVGFSIPRDDLVTFPQAYDGESEGKIDQAYGLAWAQSLNQTVNSSMNRNQRYFLANEAGQAAAIATVSAVTGEHIDHFAEVNLAGFYALAQAFHGIEACVKPWDGGRNLHDTNSGFNQSHAGYLHLDAAQALAFVRERDNLPNGDLDRTHRQQAVLDYVLWDLAHHGVLTDLGQLSNLLDVARKYVIASGGWNLLEFANEMHALTGKNLAMSTLPIATTQNNVMVNGVPQDVDIVNLPYVRSLVQTAFSQPAAGTAGGPAAKKKPASASSVPPPSTVTVDVYNGGTTNLLAAAVSQALVSAGYRAGATGSPAAQSQTVRAATQVFYGTGARANAAKIAGYFGATATPASSVAAGHVEVLLGTTSTAVPTGLGASASASASSGTAPAGAASSGTAPSAAGSSASGSSATGSSAANNGQAGGAVTVRANAPYGIPCVY